MKWTSPIVKYIPLRISMIKCVTQQPRLNKTKVSNLQHLPSVLLPIWTVVEFGSSRLQRVREIEAQQEQLSMTGRSPSSGIGFRIIRRLGSSICLWLGWINWICQTCNLQLISTAFNKSTTRLRKMTWKRGMQGCRIRFWGIKSINLII